MIGTLILSTLLLQPKLLPFFTPGDDVELQIVQRINKANETILIQAYGITNDRIANALIAGSQRGVRIFILLDKPSSNWNGSDAKKLMDFGAVVRVDAKHAIAHNKVMIIDPPLHTMDHEALARKKPTDQDWARVVVMTGSFNFSQNAQKRNAENFLVVENDPEVARKYYENWMKCWNHSTLFVPKVITTKRRRSL